MNAMSYDMKKFMGNNPSLILLILLGINSGKTTVVAVGCSKAPKPLRHFPAWLIKIQ
jgi:hypothetical protein